MSKALENKAAIVTGASRNIGAAIAVCLAAEGAKVAIFARTVEAGTSRLAGSLNEVAERIRAVGGECLPIGADLAREDQRARIVPDNIAHFAGVDILINNAAWCRYRSRHEHHLPDVRKTLEINVVAPLHQTQPCLESMQSHGGGWVVNLSNATVNHPRPAPYDFNERSTRINFNDRHLSIRPARRPWNE